MTVEADKPVDYTKLCVCNHELGDHHISWFVGTGAMLVEECEHEDCEDLPWDQQCMHFRKVSDG